MRFPKLKPAACVAARAGGLWAAADAAAQVGAPAGRIGGIAGGVGPVAAPAVGGFTPFANPFFGTGLGYGSIADPFGGYLQGAASTIAAQGEFLVKRQEARLKYEKVAQERQVTRRAVIDQWLYERRVLPTLEDERERQRQESLRRARNEPPATEIWAGDALNTLLTNLKTVQGSGSRGPSVPLDPETLRQINVSGGGAAGSAGNIGLIKNPKAMNWPLALQDSVFGQDRSAVTALVEEAVKQAEANGRVNPDVVRDLRRNVNRMSEDLRKQIANMPTSDYIEAQGFVRNLQDAVTALASPNVGNYFNRKWAAQGATVADLVEYMATNGLTFAGAVPGEEAAYTALYRAMASYDSQVGGVARGTGRMPEGQ